ncbi:hypothetical protein KAZ01_02710 [Candidatus Gracilibacteria bacterium]|nr:hypothetical protein [Candidatus Gracilibacteria bacterium]
MLYSIPENEIESKSLEEIIEAMFKDYPEVIESYNNDMIKILRNLNNLGPIENFKEKLIKLNFSISNEGLINNEDENRFIKDINSIYFGFNKFRKDFENMEIANQKKYELKEKEENDKKEEINNLNSLINSLENYF